MTSKASRYRAMEGRVGVEALRAGWPLKARYNMGKKPQRVEAGVCPACRKRVAGNEKRVNSRAGCHSAQLWQQGYSLSRCAVRAYDCPIPQNSMASQAQEAVEKRTSCDRVGRSGNTGQAL